MTKLAQTISTYKTNYKYKPGNKLANNKTKVIVAKVIQPYLVEEVWGADSITPQMKWTCRKCSTGIFNHFHSMLPPPRFFKNYLPV